MPACAPSFTIPVLPCIASPLLKAAAIVPGFYFYPACLSQKYPALRRIGRTEGLRALHSEHEATQALSSVLCEHSCLSEGTLPSVTRHQKAQSRAH